MSTPTSIANFAVDVNGNEIPIQYKAEDLVNVIAPEGYIWQRRTLLDDIKEEFYAGYDSFFARKVEAWKVSQKWRSEQPKEKLDAYDQVWGYTRRNLEEPIYGVDGDWTDMWLNNWTNEIYMVPYYIAVRKEAL